MRRGWRMTSVVRRVLSRDDKGRHPDFPARLLGLLPCGVGAQHDAVRLIAAGRRQHRGRQPRCPQLVGDSLAQVDSASITCRLDRGPACRCRRPQRVESAVAPFWTSRAACQSLVSHSSTAASLPPRFGQRCGRSRATTSPRGHIRAWARRPPQAAPLAGTDPHGGRGRHRTPRRSRCGRPQEQTLRTVARGQRGRQILASSCRR